MHLPKTRICQASLYICIYKCLVKKSLGSKDSSWPRGIFSLSLVGLPLIDILPLPEFTLENGSYDSHTSVCRFLERLAHGLVLHHVCVHSWHRNQGTQRHCVLEYHFLLQYGHSICLHLMSASPYCIHSWLPGWALQPKCEQ